MSCGDSVTLTRTQGNGSKNLPDVDKLPSQRRMRSWVRQWLDTARRKARMYRRSQFRFRFRLDCIMGRYYSIVQRICTRKHQWWVYEIKRENSPSFNFRFNKYTHHWCYTIFPTHLPASHGLREEWGLEYGSDRILLGGKPGCIGEASSAFAFA